MIFDDDLLWLHFKTNCCAVFIYSSGKQVDILSDPEESNLKITSNHMDRMSDDHTSSTKCPYCDTEFYKMDTYHVRKLLSEIFLYILLIVRQ